MEIYVNQIALQNMQDIVTRKYSELLYIIAELENIYKFLDDNIRADNEIYSKYRALTDEISNLALELKKHKEFLSNAESDYVSVEKLVLREAESIPSFTFTPTARYTSMAAPVIQLSNSGYQTQPDIASFGVNFSYLPSGVLGGIIYNTVEIEDTDGFDIRNAEWEDNYIIRSNADYLNAVTLSNMNQDNLPTTKEGYMKAVFSELNIVYLDDKSSDFSKQAITTDYGWYPTTKEDAVAMAAEGYPSVVCGASGFIGFVADNAAQAGGVAAYCDSGKLTVRAETDTFFYIHS